MAEKTIESKAMNLARCVKQRTGEITGSEEVIWLPNEGASKENLNSGYRAERGILHSILQFSIYTAVQINYKLDCTQPITMKQYRVDCTQLWLPFLILFLILAPGTTARKFDLFSLFVFRKKVEENNCILKHPVTGRSIDFKRLAHDSKRLDWFKNNKESREDNYKRVFECCYQWSLSLSDRLF